MREMREINLIDLGRMLKKRRRIFFGFLLVGLVFALVITLFIPRQYKFKQLMRISGYYDGSSEVSLIASKEVLTKITNVYLQNALDKYKKIKPNLHWSTTKIEDVAASSGLVILSTTTKMSKRNAVEFIYNSVLKQVREGSINILKYKKEFLHNYLTLVEKQLKFQTTIRGNFEKPTLQFVFALQKQALADLIEKVYRTKLAIASLHNAFFDSTMIVSAPLGVSRILLFWGLVLLVLILAAVFSVVIEMLELEMGKR